MGAGGEDQAIVTGQFQALMTSQGGWNGSGTTRQFMSSKPFTVYNFLLDIVVNENTDDGANVRIQVGGSNGNSIITPLQATGVFIDITNRDSIADSIPVNVLYTEQTLSADIGIEGMDFTGVYS